MWLTFARFEFVGRRITSFKDGVITAQEGFVRLNADAELLVGLALYEAGAELRTLVLDLSVFGESVVLLVRHLHTDFAVVHVDRAS